MATDARITSQIVEVLITGATADARITSQVVEVLTYTLPAVTITFNTSALTLAGQGATVFNNFGPLRSKMFMDF